MASELLYTMNKNANDLARGRLGTGRKAKATSGCLINVVHVRPRCPCRPRYSGRPAELIEMPFGLLAGFIIMY